MLRSRQTQRGAFAGAEDTTSKQLLQHISSLYTLEEIRLQKIERQFLDTFDWRLFRKKYLLSRNRGTLYLSHAGDSDLVQEPASSRKTFLPWELEKGELRKILQSVAGIRALLTLFSLKITRIRFALRNQDKKVVLRLFLDDGMVSGNGVEKPLPQIIHLEEVRGYNKAFTKVSRILEKNGLQKIDGDSSLFHLALSAINKSPLDYSSKFTITLEKRATVYQTIRAICLNLVTAMRKNLEGVKEDTDSEFLHDFRIAIRRTRSLLSQMKKLIPADIYTFYQDEFRWVGSITGPVRDLDVYLLKRDEYQSMLPGQLHLGLDEFFVDIAHLRKKKLAAMRKGLCSSRYAILMNNWIDFLNNEIEAHDWPHKDRVCYPLVIKMIRKRYRRLIKDGNRITEENPDQDLHRLRIQGKKLRYMLEFYTSFFQPGEVDFFLKQLKKLQNNLGDFNDISVQQEMLVAYQTELSGRSARNITIAASLGGLISHLAGEHVQVRQKFAKTFRRFASDENKEKFEKIFTLETR